jgi:hypothetical protein
MFPRVCECSRSCGCGLVCVRGPVRYRVCVCVCVLFSSYVVVCSCVCSCVGVGTGTGSHPLGWRDVYDAGVRWRQLSEPFDPVFYVDGMTDKGFEEGFGLQTPMVSGQGRVTRYYSEVRWPRMQSRRCWWRWRWR